MSDPENPDFLSPESPGGRPEELPPVEPPSAGYIVQLFLIPALIVAAVIGVWALFGMLASTDADWEQLVQELGSSNDDRRWRAAFVLAQILRNEELDPEQVEGKALADEPKVAAALTELLKESLAINSSDDEVVMHQEFLARTMGSLRSDDIVLPALAQALQPGRNIEVRKSSLMALATIAGRNFQELARTAERLEPGREYSPGQDVLTLKAPLPAPTIDNEEVWEQLKSGTQDEEAAIRHLSAYVMGVVSGPDAMTQLRVVLLDRDDKTRANAAVGLARNGQADGFPVLLELMQDGIRDIKDEDFKAMEVSEQKELLAKRQFEQPIILSNSLRALDSIWVILTQEQQDAAKPVLEKIGAEYHAANVQLQARNLIQRLEPAE